MPICALSRAGQCNSQSGRAHWEGQQQQQEQVKGITELPSSPSSQNTISLLPICMITYQW